MWVQLRHILSLSVKKMLWKALTVATERSVRYDTSTYDRQMLLQMPLSMIHPSLVLAFSPCSVMLRLLADRDFDAFNIQYIMPNGAVASIRDVREAQ